MVNKKCLNFRACRVCLNTRKNASKVTINSSWLHKFEYCFGLQLNPKDRARTLCKKCADNIHKFAKFKEKCLKSDYIWKSHTLVAPTLLSNFKIDDNIKETNVKYEEVAEHHNICDDYIKEESSEDILNVLNETIIKYNSNCSQKNLFNIQSLVKNVKLDFNIDSDTLKEEVPDTELITPKVPDIEFAKTKKPETAVIVTVCKSNDSHLNCVQETLIDLCGSDDSENSYNYQTNRKIARGKNKIKKKNCIKKKTRKSYIKKKDTISEEDNEYCSQDNLSYLSDSTSIDNVTENTAKTTHVQKQKLICECGQKISSQSLYDGHVKKCKQSNFNKKQFELMQQCGLCPFSSENKVVLQKHLDYHFAINDLQCKLCDYKGRDFAEMCYHRYSHNKVSRLYCCKCQKRCVNHRALQFHFRTVHMKKKFGGLCVYCDAKLISVKTWRNHEKRHANSDGSGNLFICDCCGLRFVYRHQIVHHLNLRAGLYKAICDQCGAVFPRQTNLKSHIKNIHMKNENVQCPQCNRTVKQNCLSIHIDRMHGEKNYVCELCSEKFRYKTLLNYHMLKHTNARPFKCDMCHLTYKTKSTLNSHRIIHTGVKMHSCGVCEKEFYRKPQLTRHMYVHTDARRAKCKYCDRSFEYKARLAAHCLKAHPEKCKK